MSIFIALLFCLGNIIYLAFNYYLLSPYVGFLNYFTLSAYRSVFNVFSEEAEDGDTFPIIMVLQNPTNESFSTIVNFDPLKGVCPLPWSSALIHYFSESRDLLI